MKLEELNKGDLVAVQPSPYRMWEGKVVEVTARKTKSGKETRGVRVKAVRGSKSEVVPFSWVRTHKRYREYLADLEQDKELLDELRAQVKALRLSIVEEGVSITVKSTVRPRIEVVAQGEAAAELINLIQKRWGRK